jgi:2'-phosphotransferase
MEEILTAPEHKVIHGTNFTAWQTIRTEGLSRMRRQHIHCAAGEPGDEGVISGMRRSCQIYIYIDVAAALADGYKFYRSANNVILCPGNAAGILPPRYFAKVKDVKKNQIIFP